ncbi:MAG: hypothetical protein IT319_16630, partial [Anaerolineae bacterium]|nr:hypothetical protein [Anaerolineae bacterium]
LGGIALALFILAAVFNSVAPGVVSESTRSSVLFQAIPFFMAFVGIILIFVLLIVIVALRFNGKVPLRTYRGIENLTIGGIIFGTVCLFNPWSFVPYRYGFLLLLISTLAFILWSHVAPPRAADADVPPLTRPQMIAGLVVGLVVLVVLTAAAVSVNGPAEPYGLRERVWNSYTPERQAQVAEAAIQQFNTVEMPFLVIFNLFPAALAFLVVRELVGGARRRESAPPRVVPAVGGGD